jgi:hypothetical protein
MGSIYQYDAFRGKQPIATSYYGIGGDLALITAVHFQWDATLVANASGITIWACNFPENGQFSVPIGNVVPGDWIQLQPPTGYTAISPAGAATLGASPLIINVPGGTAGGAFVDLGNAGAHRLAVQVVATVAGFLRIHAAGKR